MAFMTMIFKAVLGTGMGKKPSLDGLLARLDRELENFKTLVPPAAESKPRTPFDSPNLTFDQMYLSQLSLRQVHLAYPADDSITGANASECRLVRW